MNANIKYPYAYDEEGNLVFIQDVERENRHNHTYRCPNCNHPMIPRLGEHNAWCFAHCENHRCGIESYIHATAKQILAKRFNDRLIPFKNGFTSRRPCIKKPICPSFSPESNCYCSPKFQSYNLSLYYDLPAEVEVDLLESDGETHFKPDVLLRSSDSRRHDIFIEVYYKSPSSKKKIISGRQIVEIRVRDMFDLPSLALKECFEEGKDVRFYGFKPCPVTPEQIIDELNQVAIENDFPINNESVLPPCKQSSEYKRRHYHLQRFVIYKSGKTYCNGVYEKETSQHHPSAIMDITYEQDWRYSSIDYHEILAKKDIRARFCDFCEQCIKWGPTNDTWCKLGKNGSGRRGTFNSQKGTYCVHFEWKRYDGVFIPPKELEEGEDYEVWINPQLEDKK